MRALREGGRLIYSTCSLEAEENEDVVVEALERESGFRLLPWKEQVRDVGDSKVRCMKAAPSGFPGARLISSCASFPGSTRGMASLPPASHANESARMLCIDFNHARENALYEVHGFSRAAPSDQR